MKTATRNITVELTPKEFAYLADAMNEDLKNIRMSIQGGCADDDDGITGRERKFVKDLFTKFGLAGCLRK